MEEAEAVEFSPSYRILEVTEESDEESHQNHMKHEFSASQHDQSHRDTAQSNKNQYLTQKQEEIMEIDENLDNGEDQSFQYSKKKVDSSGKEFDDYYQQSYNMSFQNSPNQPPQMLINNGSLQPSQKINQNQIVQQQQQWNGVPMFNVQLQKNGENYELKNSSKNLQTQFQYEISQQQPNQYIQQQKKIQVFQPQNQFYQKQGNQNQPPQEEETRERKLSVQPVKLIDQETFLTKVSPQNQMIPLNNNTNTHHSNSSLNPSQQSRNLQRTQNSSDKKSYSISNQENQFQDQVQFLINKRTKAQQQQEIAQSSQKKNIMNQQYANYSDDEMDGIQPMSQNPNKPCTSVFQENLERQYKDVCSELQQTKKQLDEVEKSLRIETLNFEEQKRYVQILKQALQQKVEDQTLRSILADVCQDARINKVDLYTHLAREQNSSKIEGDKNKHKIVELERELKKLKLINQEQEKQNQYLQAFNDSLHLDLKNAIYALQVTEDEKIRMLAEQKQEIHDQNSHVKDQLLEFITYYKNQIDTLKQELYNHKHKVNQKSHNYSMESDNSNPNKNSQVEQQITAADANNSQNSFSAQNQQLSQVSKQGPNDELLNNINYNHNLNQGNNGPQLIQLSDQRKEEINPHIQNYQNYNYKQNYNDQNDLQNQNNLNNQHSNNHQNEFLGQNNRPNLIDYDNSNDLHIQQDFNQTPHEISQNSVHEPMNHQKRLQDEELEELLKEVDDNSIQNQKPETILQKHLQLAQVTKRLKVENEQANQVIEDFKIRLDNERQGHSNQIQEAFEQISTTRQELRIVKDKYQSMESNQIGLEEQLQSYEIMLQQKQEDLVKSNEELRQIRQIAGDRLQELNEKQIENSVLQQEVDHLNIFVQEYENSQQDKGSNEDRTFSQHQFNSQRSQGQTAVRTGNSPNNQQNFDSYSLLNQNKPIQQFHEQNQFKEILQQEQLNEQNPVQHLSLQSMNNQLERLQQEIYSKESQINQFMDELKEKDSHLKEISDGYQNQIKNLRQQLEDVQNEKEIILNENEYCKKEVQTLMEKEQINSMKLNDKKEIKQAQSQLEYIQLELEKLTLERDNLNYFVEAYKKFIFSDRIKNEIQEYIGILENISAIEFNRRENSHKINSLEIQSTQQEYQNYIIKIKEEIISLKENSFSLDDEKKVLMTRKIALEKEIENMKITELERFINWSSLEEDHQQLKKRVDREMRDTSLKEITYKNVQGAYNDLLKEYGQIIQNLLFQSRNNYFKQRRLLSQSITQQKKSLSRNQSLGSGQNFLLNKSLQSGLSQQQFSPNKKSMHQEQTSEENQQ